MFDKLNKWNKKWELKVNHIAGYIITGLGIFLSFSVLAVMFIAFTEPQTTVIDGDTIVHFMTVMLLFLVIGVIVMIGGLIYSEIISLRKDIKKLSEKKDE